jgi:membrane-associated phospholipid phosphatase
MRNPLLHQRGWLAPAVATLLALPATGALPLLSAQSLPPSPAPARPPVVTWHDAKLLGAFGLAATAVMPADRAMQRVMQRDGVQRSVLFSNAANVFNAYGSPGVFAGTAALYAAGWATRRPKVARLGLRAGETILLSGIVTGGLKGIAGRARPYASAQRPGDWRLFSGVRDGARQSFPSGHTTAAFAFAAAMDREYRVSGLRSANWVGPALYGAATLTGLARMHADKHWASDVVMGAGVGIVSGLVVARFHAGRPSQWIDRHLLPRARR